MPRAVLLIAAFAVALAACDAAPGLPTEVRRPSVTAFRLTPTADSLETTGPTASVPLVIEATLAGEGPVVVRALVRYAETDTLLAETRVEAQPGPLRIELPVVLPRGATGNYAVTLTTEGADGRTGDGASAVFRFRAASLGPPTIARIEAAAFVARPTSGVRPFPIAAAVSDPDGLANIVAVLLTDVDGNVLGRLFDDGPAGGASDVRARDGRYTAAIQVFPASDPRALPPGFYDLAVIAVDRAGDESIPVPVQFEIR